MFTVDLLNGNDDHSICYLALKKISDCVSILPSSSSHHLHVSTAQLSAFRRANPQDTRAQRRPQQWCRAVSVHVTEGLL